MLLSFITVKENWCPEDFFWYIRVAGGQNQTVSRVVQHSEAKPPHGFFMVPDTQSLRTVSSRHACVCMWLWVEIDPLRSLGARI